jgi:hypothetical protein
MRRPSPSLIVERVVFTAEEHFKAQDQIEQLARELWRSRGCRDGTALEDWLQAEREVLVRFIWSYARRHELQQSSRPTASVHVELKKPKPGILKGGRTIESRDLQSIPAFG